MKRQGNTGIQRRAGVTRRKFFATAAEQRLYEPNNQHGNFLECIRIRRDPVAPVEAGHAATTPTDTSAGPCGRRGLCERYENLA